MEQFKESRLFQSNKEGTDKFFKGTKVGSCSRIVVKKGVSVAVPYNITNQRGETLLRFKSTEKLSSATKSVYRKDFEVEPYMHVGMTRKPLMPYNPTSYRSRLPTATVIMPHKNKSQIELGDRG